MAKIAVVAVLEDDRNLLGSDGLVFVDTCDFVQVDRMVCWREESPKSHHRSNRAPLTSAYDPNG